MIHFYDYWPAWRAGWAFVRYSSSESEGYSNPEADRSSSAAADVFHPPLPHHCSAAPSLSLSFQIQVNFSSLIMAHHDEIQLSFSSSSSLYKQKRNKSNDQMFLIFTGDWVIHYRQHVESRNRGRRFIDRTVVAALRRRPVARATRHRMRGLSSQTHVVCRSVRDRISYFSFGSTPSSSWLNRIFYLRW